MKNLNNKLQKYNEKINFSSDVIKENKIIINKIRDNIRATLTSSSKRLAIASLNEVYIKVKYENEVYMKVKYENEKIKLYKEIIVDLQN